MASNNKTKTDHIVFVPPDRGFSWVVMLASFACCVVVGGIVFGSGVLANSMRSDFYLNTNLLNAFMGLLTSCYLIAGPFASALVNRFGFRLVTISGAIFAAVFFGISYFATSFWFLSITYCILGGIGLSMIYIPTITVIGFYFEKWRGLATGVALCGLGVGSSVVSSLMKKTQQRFHWRVNFGVEAVIVLLCAIFALAFRPIQPITLSIVDTEEDEKESQNGYGNSVATTPTSTFRKRLPDGRVGYLMPSSAKSSSDKNHSLRNKNGLHLFSERIRHRTSAMLDISLVLSPTLLLLATSGFIFTIGATMPLTFLFERALEHGLERDAVRRLYSSVTTTSSITAITCGALTSIPNVKPLWIYNIALTLGGVATVLSSIIVTVESEWTFAVLFGICVGCFEVLRPLIALEMFGLEKLTDVYGFLTLFEGVAVILGFFIVGPIRDIIPNYATFYFGGGLMLLSAFLCYPLTYVANWEGVRRQKSILRPV